jgi:rubrerythrin
MADEGVDEADPDAGGGDPACWLHRICPECGAVLSSAPPTVCPRCGADVLPE